MIIFNYNANSGPTQGRPLQQGASMRKSGGVNAQPQKRIGLAQLPFINGSVQFDIAVVL